LIFPADALSAIRCPSGLPFESKRFADTELGKRFVVRAVDYSNIVPMQYVDPWWRWRRRTASQRNTL